jgi:hypothetical protein
MDFGVIPDTKFTTSMHGGSDISSSGLIIGEAGGND